MGERPPTIYVAEKQCDNWMTDGISDHDTLELCVRRCEQVPSCVACSIGWSLDDFKAMASCPVVGPRDTYGRLSLWRKRQEQANDDLFQAESGANTSNMVGVVLL